MHVSCKSAAGPLGSFLEPLCSQFLCQALGGATSPGDPLGGARVQLTALVCPAGQPP